MQVELENNGEKRTVDVDSRGRVYIGREYADESIEIAFEVQE